jgi:glycerate dehydrogenase
VDSLRKLPVGLYGYGPIGRHMGRMLQAFGARVSIYDPYARDVPAGVLQCATLRELFGTSVAVSIHCGLNDATKGSVTRELLDLLPQGGVLVNTARGAIVVEEDLAAALKAGRIVAGIDVIADEHGADAWQRSALAACPNVILTQHRVSGSRHYPPGYEPPRELPEFAVTNLEAFAAGKPLINVIAAEIYDLKT